MEPIIPTYPEISQEMQVGNTENQILNSPIRENFKIESVKSINTYSIDDLIDVWVRGCTNGATLWAFCQEHEKQLPSTFEFGLELLQQEIRKQKSKDSALHEVTSSNMILIGLFQELIDKK